MAVFWEKEEDILKDRIQKLVNNGENVLKLEEIMWNSDNAQL